MPGLRVVGLACDNMVTLLSISERVGVSREAVRLWVTGQRGPGGFPPPALITPGGESVWYWERVVPWLLEHGPSSQRAVPVDYCWVTDASVHVLLTADRVLQARDALKSEPDDQVRGEFERLLRGA